MPETIQILVGFGPDEWFLLVGSGPGGGVTIIILFGFTLPGY